MGEACSLASFVFFSEFFWIQRKAPASFVVFFLSFFDTNGSTCITWVATDSSAGSRRRRRRRRRRHGNATSRAFGVTKRVRIQRRCSSESFCERLSTGGRFDGGTVCLVLTMVGEKWWESAVVEQTKVGLE